MELSLLPEPKNMKKMKSLHFRVSGKFILDLARERYWYEDAEKHAIDLLTSFSGITEKQIKKLLNGDAEISGISVCDNYKTCEQCKDEKNFIKYVEKENKVFKKELQKRKKYLEENYIKIGEFHVSKGQIEEYKLEYERLKRAGGMSFELHIEEEIDKIEDAIIMNYPFQVPNKENVNQISERNKEFISLLRNYLEELRRSIDKEWNQRTKSLTAIKPKNEPDVSEMMIKNQIAKLGNELEHDEQNKNETVKIGKWIVKKHLVDDYANSVRYTRTQALMGIRDPETAVIMGMNSLETRIEKHKAIFKSLGLMYHGDIRGRGEIPKGEKTVFFRPFDKEESESNEFSNLLTRYIEKNYPEVNV